MLEGKSTHRADRCESGVGGPEVRAPCASPHAIVVEGSRRGILGGMAKPPDVRRCGRCGEPAGLLVAGWEKGADAWWVRSSGTRPELRRAIYRCQACGAVLRFRAPGCFTVVGLVGSGLAVAFFGLGWLLFAARLTTGSSWEHAGGGFVCLSIVVLGGFVGLASLGRPLLRQRKWSPVDAPVPQMVKLAPPPAMRRCVCGAGAPNTRVVTEYVKRFVPTGRVHQHDCAECGVTFNVHDGYGIAFSICAASLLTAAGALVTLYPPGAAAGAADSNRWFGIALLGVGLLTWAIPALRIRARLRHPIQRPTTF